MLMKTAPGPEIASPATDFDFKELMISITPANTALDLAMPAGVAYDLAANPDQIDACQICSTCTGCTSCTACSSCTSCTPTCWR